MKQIKFYYEWLSLSKEHFRLLTMLTKNSGEFVGTYSDICKFLLISSQSKNTSKIRETVDFLTSEGYISYSKKGRNHHLKIKTKETEIEIPLNLVNTLVDHDYSSKPVAWEQILKVYLWIWHNNSQITTNDMLAADLDISSSTVSNAISVLEKEYEAIHTEKVTKRVSEDIYKCFGRKIDICAWWKDISKKK